MIRSKQFAKVSRVKKRNAPWRQSKRPPHQHNERMGKQRGMRLSTTTRLRGGHKSRRRIVRMWRPA